jgi:hypothetical protein
MNDPIRELWAQCVVKHTKTPMNWQDVADEFAELIVQECAGLCLKHETMPGAFQTVEYRRGRDFYTIIKNHFGLEP